ncbi:helix-turn-helix domain-containing protein [Chromobacterium rhizoryzae]|uniref:helix-turn-helix domain-containing protein n=1 Tax=Chromobacterium rhizoryzae TaxID=1778675 RepID=UPI001D0624EB|nr:helix-turn-helix transcriptional regulator [Chromobacterium rhizoryzae]
MDIGKRLREERARLELLQNDVAKAAEISYGSYLGYEKGDRPPNAEVLAKLYSIGFDILYIVTGQRNESTLPQQAHVLLNLFQQLDPRGQRLALGVMQQIHQNLSE